MRDRDVRAALHQKVLKEHHGQPDTLVLDELGLRHGQCRVDVVVVNGFLHGFEIKSDADTLDRLPGQISIYNEVLDRATLVVGERHLAKATQLLPSWWGIKVAIEGARHGIEFKTARSFDGNPSVNPVALVELLWRPEIIEILKEMGVPAATLRKPRNILYRLLAAEMELSDLRTIIRRQLKVREKWRGHRARAQDDGW
jgi:hypothetical protein